VADFYCEDGVPFQLAVELGHLGHWATTSQFQGRKGIPDEEHLWLAAQQHWILVTHNGVDFRMLQRAWRLWQVPQSHAGILVVQQIPAGLAQQMAREIDRLVQGRARLDDELYEWRMNFGWRRYRS
jgi:hypothetical protein